MGMLYGHGHAAHGHGQTWILIWKRHGHGKYMGVDNYWTCAKQRMNSFLEALTEELAEVSGSGCKR